MTYSRPQPNPLFKSCRYCRHRKKKCVLPPPGSADGRCLACQHLNTTCEISARKPSVKRQQRSQRIAASLSASASSPDDVVVVGVSPPSTVAGGGPGQLPTPGLAPGAAGTTSSPVVVIPGADSALTRVGNGDCQIPRPGDEAEKAILVEGMIQDDTILRLSTAELYHAVVCHEVPFLPGECLVEAEPALSPVVRHCMRTAARLSLMARCTSLPDSDLHELNGLLASRQHLDAMESASLMLLLSRIQPDSRLIDKAFTPSTFSESTPLPMAVGALTSYSWLAMVANPTVTLPASPPPWPPSILLDYRDSSALDANRWAPHYLKLTHLAASFVDLRRSTEGEPNTPAVTAAWAELEYTTLLNVAQMQSQYLDVRDEMPATPAATITHMLQTLVFLRVYQHLLYRNPSLGQAIGLRPVPGVVHFICALARSVFICPAVVVDHWPILADIQAVTVEVLLDMWRLTKAGNCRALLNLWKPAGPRFDGLARHVRNQIGHGPWDVEVIDGYSVFWMFRDLRSLSLEVHMRRPEGGS